MDIIEALNARSSCRSFKPDAVDQGTITKILAAATRAPSWANTQPWEILVATGEPLQRLRKGYLANFQKGEPRNPDIQAPQSWPLAAQKRIDAMMKQRGALPEAERKELGERNFRLFDAPVIIYLCVDRHAPAWSLFDLGSLAQSIMLAALDFGLQSIPAFMLASYPHLVREALPVPDNLSIAIGIALGYCDPYQKELPRTPRRPLDEVATLIGF